MKLEFITNLFVSTTSWNWLYRTTFKRVDVPWGELSTAVTGNTPTTNPNDNYEGEYDLLYLQP